MRKFTVDFRKSLRGINEINTIISYKSDKKNYILTTESEDEIVTELNDFIEIESSNYIINQDENLLVNPGFNADLFKTICKTLEIETKENIPIGTKINVKIGVKVNNSFEYMDYGYYYIKENSYNANENYYHIIAYDKMYKSMITYDNSKINIEFPITIKNLLIKICDYLNWNYDFNNFTNSDKKINNDLFGNQSLTYRDILDNISQVIVGNLMFDENETLKVKYATETNELIEEDDLKNINVDIKEKYGPVNSLIITTNDNVVLNNLNDEASINNNGKTEFKINDNYILINNSDDFIDEMFNKINGLEYYIYDINTIGLLVFEPLDKFSIKINDNIYPTLLLNDDLNISTGIKEDCYVDKPKINVEEYNSTNKDKNKLNNALISIDKANAEIVLKVDSNGNISQVRLDGDADGGTLFQVKANNINLEGYTTINNGFSIAYDGSAILKGGKIEIDDLGTDENQDILIYDSTNSDNTIRNLEVGDNLSGKVLLLNFPNDAKEFMDEEPTFDYSAILYTEYYEIDYRRSHENAVYPNIYEEVYISKHDDENYHVTLFYRENDNIKTNLTSYYLPKDFGIVNGYPFASESPGRYIKVEILNLKTYLAINSKGMEIQDVSNNVSASYKSNGMTVEDSTGRVIIDTNTIELDRNGHLIYMTTDDSIYIENNKIFDVDGRFSVAANGNIYNTGNYSCSGNITCVSLTQTSLKENKKNFEKYSGALEEIKNIDIYKYNLKNEENDSKKHLGFVIGNDFNYSKVITSDDNKGVDNYSFTSLCLQAIKEQQEQIENLQKQVNELKEMIKNG